MGVVSDPEVFSVEQIKCAISQWLEYGQRSFRPYEELGAGHRGYFSDSGWAARCLSFTLKQFDHCWRPYPANAEDMATFLEGYSDFVSEDRLRRCLIEAALLLRREK